MIYHGRSVQRGTSHALVVVDLPFLSYQVSRAEAVRNAGRILKRTGAGAVKLEGGSRWAPTVDSLVAAGIPVMGHLGFTPQAMHVLGGIRIQGREASAALRLIDDARALESAGAFALVLEFMSAAVAEQVTAAVSIPTIGIGAGVHCDGQVLVLHDMLGMNEQFNAKFVKRYAQLAAVVRTAAESFATEVRAGQFPDTAHSHRSGTTVGDTTVGGEAVRYRPSPPTRLIPLSASAPTSSSGTWTEQVWRALSTAWLWAACAPVTFRGLSLR